MRTAALAPFLPTIAKLTTEAREKHAAALFDIEAVRLAITKAACLGQDRLFLRPGDPVDLQRTAAAIALTAHLTGLGLTTFWHAYTVDSGDRPTTGFELEISWRS